MSFQNTFTLTTAIVNYATGGIFNAIVGLVAIILFFILYIQFIMRGFEIWILKLYIYVAKSVFKSTNPALHKAGFVL